VESILSVQELVVSYGAVEALKGVTLELHPGDIVAVLGANGAGKTTLLKAISGLLPVKKGEIFLNNKGVKDHFAHLDERCREWVQTVLVHDKPCI